MLPCGHIFGLTCIWKSLVRYPRCPLCTGEYMLKVSTPIDFTFSYMWFVLQDFQQNVFLGPLACRYMVWMCLSPTFLVIGSIMGCGPHKERPRDLWRYGVLRAIGFQTVVLLNFSSAASLAYLSDRLVLLLIRYFLRSN